MKTAALYARYSSDLQNEKSIEDQLALCRKHCKAKGYVIAFEFIDKAKSGASLLGREGVLKLMAEASSGKFDVVVTEALDRVSRDIADLATVHKNLKHWGVEIDAVNDGIANTLMVGLRGIIGQMYREDNVEKVKRGMTGLIEAGKSAGGRSYGYKPDPVNKGNLIVVPEEAEVVLRIFQEFADGYSPRKITLRLNGDAIPAPRGKVWTPSALHGSLARGSGILHNHLYIGKLVWNRVRMVKDPNTGKRVSRVNEPEEWQYKDVPDLRIIPQHLWDEVHKEKRVSARPKATRSIRMLTGLIKCGSCGGPMTVQGIDKSGKNRLRCETHHRIKGCPNPFTTYLQPVEEAVLAAVSKELEQPEVMVAYLKEYHAERKRLQEETEIKRRQAEKELANIKRENDSLLKQAARYETLSFESIVPRLEELVAEKKRWEMAIEALPEKYNEVALHPSALARYERMLFELKEALAHGRPDGDSPAGKALRDIVQRVVVSKGENGEITIEITGAMNALLKAPAMTETVMGFVGSGSALPSNPLTINQALIFTLRVRNEQNSFRYRCG